MNDTIVSCICLFSNQNVVFVIGQHIVLSKKVYDFYVSK